MVLKVKFDSNRKRTAIGFHLLETPFIEGLITVAEQEDSTPLIPKSTTRHDPQAVPTGFHFRTKLFHHPTTSHVYKVAT
jgi:hypothetical protein